MSTASELTRALCGVLTCLLALACTGETRVSLLEPIGAGAGGSTSTGGNAASGGNASAGGNAGGSPTRGTANLIHRYSFNGEGERVVDSIGAADGALEGGAVLDGAGHAALDGKDDYVNLPNGLISGLESATLIGWLSWSGGPCWQRAFDFGSTDAGEDVSGNATSSLFATPLRCPGTGPTATFEDRTGPVGSVDSDVPFPVLMDSPLVVVVDGSVGQLRMYAAGAALGTGKALPLSGLSDVNDWLGRSQWVQDLYLRGTYDEFRIYDIALSDEALLAIEAAGPEVF
jgi:Concanavalin A-like lectin/glucanases superfamily